jgi:hypothetical protein
MGRSESDSTNNTKKKHNWTEMFWKHHLNKNQDQEFNIITEATVGKSMNWFFLNNPLRE